MTTKREWKLWAVAVLVLSLLGTVVAQAQQKVVVASWGGAYMKAQRQAHFDAFTKATGIEVVEVSPATYGKLKVMVTSRNVEWDVVDADSDYSIRGGKDGLLEKLDYAKMGLNKDDFLPGTQHDYGAGRDFNSIIMAWNTKKIPEGQRPTGWKDFWDVKKFPGPRSLNKDPRSTLEAALIADGVPIDKLYPLDVDRAFRSLDRIKPHVTVWWEIGGKPGQLLTDGEVVMAASPGNRIRALMRQGVPVDFTWNGGGLTWAAWVVPKGAKNYDLALKFIAFTQSARQQAEMAKLWGSGPTHKDAFRFIDPKADLASTPINRAVQVFLDVRWWVDNLDKINERFQGWLLKG